MIMIYDLWFITWLLVCTGDRGGGRGRRRGKGKEREEETAGGGGSGGERFSNNNEAFPKKTIAGFRRIRELKSQISTKTCDS